MDLGASRLRNLNTGKNATHTSAKTVHRLLRSRLHSLHAGKNATHTSAKTVHGLLRSLSEEVSTTITDSIQQSPAYSVMANEMMDVTSRKHLAMLCRYAKADGSTDTVL